MEESRGPLYCLMGGTNMQLVSALDVRGLPIRHVKHEASAVAMAEGCAQATGDPGIATVTSGPGLTQVATSLVVASRSRTPLVLLTGDTPLATHGGLQEFEHQRFAAACEAGYVGLRTSQDAATTVREAFNLARQQRRPVVLDLPVDIQQESIDASLQPLRASVQKVPRPRRMVPVAADLERAADWLTSAHQVLIVAGQGASSAGAVSASRAVAERLGAALGTTLLSKGAFDQHDLDLGVIGGFSNAEVVAALEDVDLVLALGTSLEPHATRRGKVLAGRRLIWIDKEPPRPVGPDVDCVQLQGDARATLLGLLDLLPVEGGVPRDAIRAAARTRRQRAHSRAGLPADRSGRLHPARLIGAVQAALPPDLPIVIGVGHHWGFAIEGLYPCDQRKLWFSHQFGAVGQTLPLAMGLCDGADAQPLLVIDGDGSLMMHVQELATLAASELPILVLAVNDGAYGAEVHKLTAMGEDPSIARFGVPDLRAAAHGLGLEAQRLAASDEVASAIGSFVTDPRPFLLDAPVDGSVVSDMYRRMHFGEDI